MRVCSEAPYWTPALRVTQPNSSASLAEGSAFAAAHVLEQSYDLLALVRHTLRTTRGQPADHAMTNAVPTQSS
jgi:hypothetical protein